MKPKKRPITAKEHDWLAGAIGLHALPERPGLKELLAKLPSLELLAYGEGATILPEGRRPDEFFVLHRGAASVEKDGRLVAELVPGDFFGEVGFLLSVPSTATVRAGSGCEVFRLKRLDLEQIVKRVTGLEAMLKDVARQRLRKLENLK